MSLPHLLTTAANAGFHVPSNVLRLPLMLGRLQTKATLGVLLSFLLDYVPKWRCIIGRNDKAWYSKSTCFGGTAPDD